MASGHDDPATITGRLVSRENGGAPIYLNQMQREIMEATIREHCAIRGWRLHVVNCRSNHCHCVVTASNHDGEQVRDQLKSWCTRQLKEAERRKPPGALPHNDDRPDGSRRACTVRNHWWTAKGSVRHLYDDESLAAAIIYTVEAQDVGGSHANQ